MVETLKSDSSPNLKDYFKIYLIFVTINKSYNLITTDLSQVVSTQVQDEPMRLLPQSSVIGYISL